jgi:3-mercaptopyruvate sulfurtransferase SseA
MRRHLVTAFVVFVIGGASVAAQPAPQPSLLVSTAWLAGHLRDSDLVLLWSGQGSDPGSVIPGSRVVPHESVMRTEGGHDLTSVEDLVVTLRQAGVSNRSHVVIYGEPMAAGWLFFALDYLGHSRVSLLDGGLPQWRAEQRPVAASAPASAPGDFTPAVRAGRKAMSSDVQRQVADNRTVLLDARSPQEYELGHIPRAKLLSWEDVFARPDAPVFKSREELAALFAKAGAAPGTPVTTYCAVGLRASVLYFAAKYAGLDPQNYVGSWRDWRAKGLPQEP